MTVFRRSYRQYVPSPAMAQGRGGQDMEADMKEDRNGKQVGEWRRLTLVTLHTCYYQVIVGVCAMEKKTLSKPMKEILTRLEEFEHISTSIFPEVVILNVRAEHFLEYV